MSPAHAPHGSLSIADRLPFAASLQPAPHPPAADAWAEVRIDAVMVEPEPSLAAGDHGLGADGATRCVLARLHLGRLLPVDVEVHLVRADAVADDLPAQGSAVRLCSRHPYGNGAYLFEAHVPAALLAADRLKVHVAPRGMEVLPFAPPVGLWRLVPPPAAPPERGTP